MPIQLHATLAVSLTTGHTSSNARLAITFSEALRAAGDATWAMGARIVLAWGFLTPFAWLSIFKFGGGVPTVVASLMAFMAGLLLTFALRFHSGKWKQIQLIEPQLSP